jgi:hypothetical protein
LFLRNSIELAVEKVGMSKDVFQTAEKQLESGVSFVIDLNMDEGGDVEFGEEGNKC